MPRPFDRATAEQIAVNQAISDLEHILENANDTIETVKHLKYLLQEHLGNNEFAQMLEKLDPGH